MNHKCPKHYTLLENGLLQDWGGETAFVNPLFSHKDICIRKCYQEALKSNTTVVLIIPATTDTRSWHTYVMKADETRFCAGRVNFVTPLAPGKPKNGATFPLVVVVFRARHQAYLHVNSFIHKQI